MGWEAYIPVIQAGLDFFSNWQKNEADRDNSWLTTEAGAREKWAFEAEQEALAREQALQIQKMVADAQLAAAGIHAGATTAAARMSQGASMFATRDKFLTDNLAARYAAKRDVQEAQKLGVTTLPQYAQARGIAGMQGYNQAADILSRFKA